MRTQLNIVPTVQPAIFSMPVMAVNQSPFMQATLAHEVSFEGIGMHLGLPVSMTIRPAAPYTGFVFIRSDIQGKDARIPAVYDAVVDTMMCTKISNVYGVTISTVEHVIAALQGMGITNAEITVSSAEVPIMDGSSCIYTEQLAHVGRSVQSARQRTLKIQAPVRVSNDTGFAEFVPSHSRIFDINVDFAGRLTGSGFETRFTFDLDNDDFHVLLSDARTYGFYEDAVKLQKAGLAKGASLDNAVVFQDKIVLNEGGLRSNDELVRHKVLDAVGDIALSGCAIMGTFRAHNPGHGLNNQLLRVLFATPSAFSWVD
ncbi:MAG: UDP-3-O-acyl-N-acetylglucosamine deacetylase [Pseudomonadota bacterium]